jgi:hypothetical protein
MTEHVRVSYDPFVHQPQTLGDLEHWMRAAKASANAQRMPFPVSLNKPPIPGFDRLAALALEETGGELTVEFFNRLIGRFVRVRGVSTEVAKAASLEEAADVLAPPLRRPMEGSHPAVASDGPGGDFNPLHALMEELDGFHRVIVACQAASEFDDFVERNKAFLAYRDHFWKRHRLPGDAVSNLRGAAITWCGHRFTDNIPYREMIFRTANCVVELACLNPLAACHYYLAPERHQERWDAQTQVLMRAEQTLAEIRGLADYLGQHWERKRPSPQFDPGSLHVPSGSPSVVDGLSALPLGGEPVLSRPGRVENPGGESIMTDDHSAEIFRRYGFDPQHSGRAASAREEPHPPVASSLQELFNYCRATQRDVATRPGLPVDRAFSRMEYRAIREAAQLLNLSLPACDFSEFEFFRNWIAEVVVALETHAAKPGVEKPAGTADDDSWVGVGELKAVWASFQERLFAP